MSPDDMRNTLIVEMTAHSTQTDYQSFNDFDLAGMGAVMVFLRGARIRTDAELKTMSADDQRNVAIVEIGSQTNLGSKLQGLRVDPVFEMPRASSYRTARGQCRHRNVRRGPSNQRPAAGRRRSSRHAAQRRLHIQQPCPRQRLR